MVPTSSGPDAALSAWIDESVLVGDDQRPGTYTLAAVVTEDAALDGLRADLEALTERKVARLHWVAESAKRRDAMPKPLLVSASWRLL